MRHEKAGLLATVIQASDGGSGYFREFRPRSVPREVYELTVDASLDLGRVTEEYDLAVQELRVACSTEAAYPD